MVPSHFLGCSWGCHYVWDNGKHAVWWRELESLCRKHLSLFLLFCPIFLLLESGRVCKWHSFCSRPYVCPAAVVTVALLSVLHLMCSFLCVCPCLCVPICMNSLFKHYVRWKCARAFICMYCWRHSMCNFLLFIYFYWYANTNIF